MAENGKHSRGIGTLLLVMLPIVSLSVSGWHIYGAVEQNHELQKPQDALPMAAESFASASSDAEQRLLLVANLERASIFATKLTPVEMDVDDGPLATARQHWRDLETIHAAALALLSSEMQPLEQRIAQLTTLVTQWGVLPLEAARSDLLGLADSRLRLWQAVQRSQELAQQAQNAFAQKDFVDCALFCSQMGPLIAPYGNGESWDYFRTQAELIAELKPQTEILALAWQAYEHLPESDDARMDAMKLFLRRFSPDGSSEGKTLHDTASAPLVAELLVQAERELADLSIAKLFDQQGPYGSLPLSRRIKVAHSGFQKYPDVEARETIRTGIRAWLDDVLQPRPLPDIHPDLKDAIGVGTGKIVVGIFLQDEEDPLLYRWWKTPEDRIRSPQTPQLTVTTDSQNYQVGGAIRFIQEPPREPFIARSVKQYNAAVRALKDPQRQVSLLAWQTLAELCGELEEEAARHRSFAKKDEGVVPADFQELYQEISFRQPVGAVQEILDSFPELQAILAL